ncbi:MAG: ComEC/Rec2 family competence protein, partial [Actinomycetota bacterium]
GPLERRLAAIPRPVALALAATLAAQAAVAPLLVLAFGELSLAAPLANPLAVPAVPPATVLGLAAGLAGVLDADAGAALARLAGPFLSWIVFVGEGFGAPAWASLEVPSWCGWVLSGPVVLAARTALRTQRAAGRHPGTIAAPRDPDDGRGGDERGEASMVR